MLLSLIRTNFSLGDARGDFHRRNTSIGALIGHLKAGSIGLASMTLDFVAGEQRFLILDRFDCIVVLMDLGRARIQ
jgi:hypothetical protein